MLLTRKTDYALVALAGLARRSGGAASARDLAEQFHLPLPVLRNILKVLASGGLLTSSRGPSGGYRLARLPREISLAEIVEVIEGPMQLVTCCPPGGDVSSGSDGVDHACQLEDSCLIKLNVGRVHDRLMGFLHEVTLDQIAPDAAVATGTVAVLRTEPATR